MNQNPKKQSEPTVGPIFLSSEEESGDTGAVSELDEFIEYCTFTIKVKGEDNPRCFDLSTHPEIRNLILSALI